MSGRGVHLLIVSSSSVLFVIHFLPSSLMLITPPRVCYCCLIHWFKDTTECYRVLNSKEAQRENKLYF